MYAVYLRNLYPNIVKYFISFNVFIFLVSCTEATKEEIIVQEEVLKSDTFFPDYYSKDTLSLNVGIDACGEWGGPEDEFKIYMDSLRQYRLNYKRYKMNCDSIWKYYGKNEPLEFQKELLLTNTAKKVISDFLIALMDAKIKERVESNAGSVYCLANNDSTLYIRIHSTERKIEEDFYKFKKSLVFPENRRKEDGIPLDSIW